MTFSSAAHLRLYPPPTTFPFFLLRIISRARHGDTYPNIQLSLPFKTPQMSRQPKLTVFRGTRIGSRHMYMPESGLEEFLGTLATYNITAIDTAQSYGNSEAMIGQVEAGDRFAIDTKWSSPWSKPGTA